MSFDDLMKLFFGAILIFSSLGVILSKKPVYSALYFLCTLLALSALYAELSAEFIAVMQILVYAGAILVIFMFVMVLFQDAHAKIIQTIGLSSQNLLLFAAFSFIFALLVFVKEVGLSSLPEGHPSADFGTVQSLGKLLYLDFFFPFEAILMLFLIASIGTVYIGKKES
ncbi:MAG: NADH-quinone oxidoreductase subunit J [Parachlamydiaceae bacterium]|nr:NADH-quinone oxidoreductase subunit J [Parachlamydiaceae bacterium]